MAFVILVCGLEICLDPPCDPLGNRYRDCVAQRVVAQCIHLVRIGNIKDVWNRPVLRETLQSLTLNWHQPPDPAIRIRHIIAAPIRACVSCRAGVEAVSKARSYWSCERISNAFLKGGNRFLPILSVRRIIPLAAFGLKKYLSGTSPVSMTADNVDSLT